LGWDNDYILSILEEATAFEAYAKQHGEGDPPAGPRRVDDPNVLQAMAGTDAEIHVRCDPA
jgi:hypothetical protein